MHNIISIRDSIFAGCGLGLGSLSGYLIARRNFARKLEDLAEEVEARFEQITSQFAEDEEPDDDSDEEPDDEEDLTVDNFVISEETMRKLGRVGNVFDDTPPGPVFRISEEAFSNDKVDYEKLGLYYYGGDKTLINEDREIVDNGGELIGSTLDFLDGQPALDGLTDLTLFVRNDNLSRDYEIVCSEKLFCVDVLGYDPAEVQPSPRG